VMDEERREHVQKMKKMEAEMEQVFEMKVKEKMQKLKDSENDVSSIFSIELAGCSVYFKKWTPCYMIISFLWVMKMNCMSHQKVHWCCMRLV